MTKPEMIAHCIGEIAIKLDISPLEGTEGLGISLGTLLNVHYEKLGAAGIKIVMDRFKKGLADLLSRPDFQTPVSIQIVETFLEKP